MIQTRDIKKTKVTSEIFYFTVFLQNTRIEAKIENKDFVSM